MLSRWWCFMLLLRVSAPLSLAASARGGRCAFSAVPYSLRRAQRRPRHRRSLQPLLALESAGLGEHEEPIPEAVRWAGSRALTYSSDDGEVALHRQSEAATLQLSGFRSILPPAANGEIASTATADAESATDTPAAPVVVNGSGWPLKVMVFVDGTWLYYCFYGRGARCPISKKFGHGWARQSRVKWGMLPVIIGQCVQEQMRKYMHTNRYVEVSRTIVFSSARADTPPESDRMQMFRAMSELNFEVHMATTKGVQEKCIDIALATDILHYATVPDAYDMAVLVTGDKDFMPVMSRTRQKGKRVCLASMRGSCNLSLTDPSAHVRDLDIIWLDDHLEELIVYEPREPRASASGSDTPGWDFVSEVVAAVIEKNGGVTGSRDLGRELQCLEIDGHNALALIKTKWGGLSRFVETGDSLFEVREKTNEPRGRGARPRDAREFLVLLRDEENSMMSAKLGGLDEELSSDSESDDENGSVAQESSVTQESSAAPEVSAATEPQEQPLPFDEQALAANLKRRTVPELKDMLRSKGLSLQGNKAALIDRLMEASTAAAEAMRRLFSSQRSTSTDGISPPSNSDSELNILSGVSSGASEEDAENAEGLNAESRNSEVGLQHDRSDGYLAGVAEEANGGASIDEEGASSPFSSAARRNSNSRGASILSSPRVQQVSPPAPWAPNSAFSAQASERVASIGGFAERNGYSNGFAGNGPPAVAFSSRESSSSSSSGSSSTGLLHSGPPAALGPKHADDVMLVSLVLNLIDETADGGVSSRDVGRQLARTQLPWKQGGSDTALQYIKQEYGGVRLFLMRFPHEFKLVSPSGELTLEFLVQRQQQQQRQQRAEVAAQHEPRQ